MKKVLACLALILGCSGEQPAPAPAARVRTVRPFNIAIVVLDACRADKMGFDGFDGGTTPELDALARDPDAVVFRNHYVQASWTKPSTASLFTGLYAHQHGVLRGHTPRSVSRGGGLQYSTQILPDSQVTMAERLKALGFHTFGIVKSHHLVPQFGFAQGFDQYVGPESGEGDHTRVEMFLSMAAASKSRFFGYLHVNACHDPYPEGERDAEYMLRHPMRYDEKGRKAAGVDFSTVDIGERILNHKLKLTPRDVRYLHLVYEAQVRRVDRQLVRPLLEGMRQTGLVQNTLLVVTADHGEELYDHGGYEHGHDVWQELIRVPMVVKFPRGRRPSVLGVEVTRMTRSIDLLPALLDLLGAPVPSDLPGVPIFKGRFGDFTVAQAMGRRALVMDGDKLIAGPGGMQLFHLDTDPRELHDLASKKPRRVEEMNRRLASILLWRLGQPPDANVTLTPEAKAQLKALGYLR